MSINTTPQLPENEDTLLKALAIPNRVIPDAVLSRIETLPLSDEEKTILQDLVSESGIYCRLRDAAEQKDLRGSMGLYLCAF